MFSNTRLLVKIQILLSNHFLLIDHKERVPETIDCPLWTVQTSPFQSILRRVPEVVLDLKIFFPKWKVSEVTVSQKASNSRWLKVRLAFIFCRASVTSSFLSKIIPPPFNVRTSAPARIALRNYNITFTDTPYPPSLPHSTTLRTWSSIGTTASSTRAVTPPTPRGSKTTFSRPMVWPPSTTLH